MPIGEPCAAQPRTAESRATEALAACAEEACAAEACEAEFRAAEFCAVQARAAEARSQDIQSTEGCAAWAWPASFPPRPPCGRAAAARRVAALAATGLAAALLAFAATSWRAATRLAEVLPAALEGRELEVAGVIDGLPQRSLEAWRFRFAVESAREGGAAVRLPPRLALTWYAQAGEALPALRAGQRWRLGLRLKRPHGLANPQGFDAELYLFEQGVGATGSVRGGRAVLLDERAAWTLDRLRQAVRDAIDARLRTPGDGAAGEQAREAGVLAALAVGDQAAIARDDWALYRDTGVAHLMSISGLHVTMFAWLAGGALGAAWRRSARLVRACPAPRAARWGGLATALAYAAFAGWGVPAQRTVLMLAVATALAGGGLQWPWPLVCGAAAVAVAAVDPWALLQPGLWLSFGAVALLLASGTARTAAAPDASSDAAPDGNALCAVRRGFAAARRALAGGLRTQAVATLGLAPLTLVCFQQLALVGFAANLVAIPLVTLGVTPLALLGVLLPPLWDVAAALVRGLDALLAALATPAWAVWSVPAAGPAVALVALAGGALALLPLPRRVRALGAALVLPLLLPPPARPPWGRVEALAVDVGQGGAVLLRTATHTLLYDAGPQYGPEVDAGGRVLRPLLRALGERRIDLLLLSHRDADHIGGAEALLEALPVERLSSSLEPAHPLLALAARRGVSRRPCADGQRWEWDGVGFELLHPPAGAGETRRGGLATASERAQLRAAGARGRRPGPAGAAAHGRHRARAGGGAAGAPWHSPRQRRAAGAASRQQDLLEPGLHRRGGAPGRGGPGRLSQPLRPSGPRGAAALSRARHRGGGERALRRLAALARRCGLLAHGGAALLAGHALRRGRARGRFLSGGRRGGQSARWSASALQDVRGSGPASSPSPRGP
jgi:competence protein ComEC